MALPPCHYAFQFYVANGKLSCMFQMRSVDTFLVGRPLHMSGADSRQSEYTKEFAERLSNYTGIPIVYWDERLTSAEAERLLRSSGASLLEKKKSVDRLAAVLLLESYLGYLQQKNTLPQEQSLD